MPGSKRHILIVDDNEHNREVMALNLDAMGYEWEEACDGREAIQRLERSRPDLILLDVMMPHMDGIEVTTHLRRNRAYDDIPIIMVTAKSDSRDIVRGLKAGANDYVAKPIDFDVLMARIETHLRVRNLQEEARRVSETLQRELDAARVVQESLLPSDLRLQNVARDYDLRVAALWRPCETLGGDFWDALSLADGSLGISMIDFAGVGVVPSLNTFRIKSFLVGQCTGLSHPSLTLARLNVALLEILPPMEIALGLYARYDPARQQLQIASAGYPAPLIYRARTGAVEVSRAGGKPLAAFAETMWRDHTLNLETGDKFMLFSDGLLKVGAKDGRTISAEQVAGMLARDGAAHPKEIATELEKTIDGLGGPVRDDVTVVIAEVAG